MEGLHQAFSLVLANIQRAILVSFLQSKANIYDNKAVVRSRRIQSNREITEEKKLQLLVLRSTVLLTITRDFFAFLWHLVLIK